ncbi:hypothetical protein Ahy_B05g076345 isoform B [Arachis hypogaea]|uniref:Uncharacterized protein n=1 Tax=Arachis hypogaea TaxID=3818 RepID=A0A444Z352_ARAHY|nr:hypothetical protein Ahy_B05g076345 isoform B [Arachis hypogaea]
MTPSSSTSSRCAAPRLSPRPCFTAPYPCLALRCLTALGPCPRLLFLVVVGEVVVVVVVVLLAFPASPLRLPFSSLLDLRYPDLLPPPPRNSTVTAIIVVSIEAEGG